MRFVPAWLSSYRREELAGDTVAGAVVAVMLVPQGMAYALLAGLPPQVGLYASIAPLLLYAAFGSSRYLAVGPVAIISLLVASTLAPLADPGSAEYVRLAVLLALLAGVLQLVLGLARMGALVNFLSHAVVSGFTSAAALVIALSQVRALTGIDVPRSQDVASLIASLIRNAGDASGMTLAIGSGSIALLVLFSRWLPGRLRAWGVPDAVATPLTRSAPLVVVVAGSAVVALTGTAAVRTVGSVPAGLPAVAVPSVDWASARPLIAGAVAIALVGFMESYAVAKSLASRRRERIDANRELVGLGLADLGAALTGAYPVTGGFSRSLVNDNAGARSPLASIITAALIAITLLWFTPLFRDIPHAVLAAIIVVAVSQLIDPKAFPRLWKYSKADGAAWLATFATVLFVGVEPGIVTGAVVALGLHLWRTSRPHIAIVGRVGDSEHFRNVERHTVSTVPHLLAIRIDESLYFANAAFLEQWLLSAIAERPEVTQCVLIMSAVNFIDGGALETLEHLTYSLREGGVTLHFAEVKGPVMDRLNAVGFGDRLAPGRFFLSTHEAVTALA